MAAYPWRSASTALRIRLRAMRNSVIAWVVVAGGVVVWKVAENSGSRIVRRCASTFAMYGAMCTRSVAPWNQILNFSLMDEREHPQWRAAAVPDLERRGDDHGARRRQLVEVGEALETVTAGAMHVVMARVGRAQVIGL